MATIAFAAALAGGSLVAMTQLRRSR
jgi:hypothetical protein